MKKRMFKFLAENSAMILSSTSLIMILIIAKTWFGSVEAPQQK